MADDRVTALLTGWGAQMRAHRTSQGRSLEDVAEQVGINFASLSNIERGKVGVSVDVLLRIADALGVPPGRLYTWHTPDRRAERREAAVA